MAKHLAGAADPLSNWRVRFQEPGASFRRVVYGNNVFLAFGTIQTGSINVSSSSGMIWERYVPSEPVEPLMYVGGLFFSDTKVSLDGVVWTNLSQRFPMRVASGNGFYVGVDTTSIVVSSNLFDWTVAVSNSPIYFRGLTFGNGVFVAAGDEGGRSAIVSSLDGRHWTYRRFRQYEFILTLDFGNGTFLAAGNFLGSTNLLTSRDALTWIAHQGPFVAPVVVFTGTRFICAAQNITNSAGGWIFDSLDGTSWSGRPLNLPYYPAAISFGNQTIVLAADEVILQSEPLTNAPSVTAPQLAAQMHAGITITGQVGRVYQIQQAATLKGPNVWQSVTNVLLTESPFLWLDPNPATTNQRTYRAVVRY
jgi:hypothetical protein